MTHRSEDELACQYLSQGAGRLHHLHTPTETHWGRGSGRGESDLVLIDVSLAGVPGY